VGRSTFDTLHQTGAKWERKTHFANLLVAKRMHRFTRFSAADFREI